MADTEFQNEMKKLGKKLIEEYAQAAGYTSSDHFLLMEFQMTTTKALYENFPSVIQVLFTDLSRRMAKIEHAMK